jgi:hypothetical protein
LPVLPSAAEARTWRDRARSLLVRVYRLLIIVGIVWVLHRHEVRLRVNGDSPITLGEAKAFFPSASKLEPDPSERQGLYVADASGRQLGYVLRTSPISDKIVGYSGPTDTLIAMDADMRVIGVRIRKSADTPDHVKSVATDDYFLKTWDKKTWDQVAGTDPRAAGIEGVSGASLTSMGMANAIRERFAASKKIAADRASPGVHVRAHDVALIAVIAVAMLFTFSSHLRGRTWFRRAFQVVLIGYVGFWNGQILAQSLMAGWASAGPDVPWRTAPALALLLAAALVVPWTSRRALYCSQICPHGAAQELLGRITKRKAHVPRGVDRGLRWLPPMLVLLVLFVTVSTVPFDLAGIEPFDAYLLRNSASIAIAIIGLVAAVFVPMAYCKYGCPTGAVLNFVRAHGGKAEKFGQRDLVAGILLGAVTSFYLYYDAIHVFVVG